MATINATQAEKLYNTPRMTIRRWIKAGRLVADESGYFEPADLEACLATKRPHASKADKAPPARRPRRQTLAASAADPDVIDPAAMASRSQAAGKTGAAGAGSASAGNEQARAGAEQMAIGKQIDNKLKYSKAQIEELKLMSMLKQVLDYNAVASAFSLLSSALEEQFRAFDEREGAALHALAQKTPVQEWSAELRDKIDKSIDSMLALIKKELVRLKSD